VIPAPPTTTRPRLDLRANAAAALAAGGLRVARRRLPLLALLGAVFFAAFPVSFNTGLRHTEASRGALMLATMPIWSALLGRIAGEGLGGHQLAGVGLSVVGIGLAFAEPGWAAGGTAALLGDGCCC
jgi:drug/metabolite transporter (DMT)-like permease